MKLAFLRPLYEQHGPYVSVYLATGRHTADAAKSIALRWRHARIELGRLGADDTTLNAIGDLVTDRRNAAPGRAVFAAGGRVVHTEALSEPPPQSVRLSPLPDVMPLLERREEPIPHVRVKADRQGADIVAVGGRDDRTTTVQGADWPLRKVKAGGWSESRYQRSAEETWEQNAREVASQVAREAAAVNAELILVGGDIRARELVLANLAEPYSRRAVPAEHGARAAGASEDAWAEEAEAVVRDHAGEHRDALVARFREAYGRGDAIAGLPAVTEALRGGQVETLLVAGPVRGELWYGAQAHEVGASAAELRELGVGEPHAEAAGAVLARALTSTDAEMVFAEDMQPPGRIGALLRYTV